MDETIRVVSLCHLSHVKSASLRLCVGILDAILDIPIKDTFASRHREHLTFYVFGISVMTAGETLHLQLLSLADGASVTIGLTVNVSEVLGISRGEHQRVATLVSRS